MAIDYEGIIEGYYKGNGILTPTLTAPALDPDGAFLYENLPADVKEAYTYNPERARELLAEAGYPDGFKTTITTSPDRADLVSLVVGWWNDVGIEAEIEIAEVGALWGIILGHTMETPLATAWGFGSEGPGVYSHNEAGELYLYNGGLVDCPKCDEWYIELNTAFDDDRRAELYMLGSMEALVNQFQIVLPAEIQYNFWQPWVGGYRGETSSGFYNGSAIWNFIWVDEDLK